MPAISKNTAHTTPRPTIIIMVLLRPLNSFFGFEGKCGKSVIATRELSRFVAKRLKGSVNSRSTSDFGRFGVHGQILPFRAPTVIVTATKSPNPRGNDGADRNYHIVSLPGVECRPKRSNKDMELYGAASTGVCRSTTGGGPAPLLLSSSPFTLPTPAPSAGYPRVVLPHGQSIPATVAIP